MLKPLMESVMQSSPEIKRMMNNMYSMNEIMREVVDMMEKIEGRPEMSHCYTFHACKYDIQGLDASMNSLSNLC